MFRQLKKFTKIWNLSYGIQRCASFSANVIHMPPNIPQYQGNQQNSPNYQNPPNKTQNQAGPGPAPARQNNFKFSTGSKYEGFLCTDVQPIHEFNMTAYVFKHEKLGSKYLHLDRDDPNNVFSINFRTTPPNSYGAFHILEHNVLCGSERFPGIVFLLYVTHLISFT